MEVGCGLVALLLAAVLALGAFVAVPGEVSVEETPAPMIEATSTP